MWKVQAADVSILRDLEVIEAAELSPLSRPAEIRAGLWKRNPEEPWLKILRRGGAISPATSQD